MAFQGLVVLLNNIVTFPSYIRREFIDHLDQFEHISGNIISSVWLNENSVIEYILFV